MLELRPYQQEAVRKIREGFISTKREIFQLVTSGGKTIIFSELARLSQLKGSNVLILSSRTEILTQNGGALEGRGLNVTYITPKYKDVPSKKGIALAMSQTLKRRIDKQEWIDYIKSLDLVIIDEAHEQVSNFIFDIISDNCYVLGVTASPVRYGGQRQLGLDYNNIVSVVKTQDLINMGYVSQAKHYTLSAPKVDNVDIDYNNGDYNQKALAKHFEKKVIYKGIVDNYMRITPHKKAIAFCVSSKQTIELTKAFCEAGIKAKYLLSADNEDDDILSDDRKKLISDFAKGDFEVLVNCGCLVAGFDDPLIEVCILGFSTISLTKYLQCVGRAARKKGNKNTFYILDFGGCVTRHGLFEQNRTWSLWHNTSKGGGVPMTKECPQCHKLIPISYTDCPFCKFHFNSKAEEYNIFLEEIVKTMPEKVEDMSIEQYCVYCKQRGWKNKWILSNILAKNPRNQKRAFQKAISVLRGENGEQISPNYFYAFKKYHMKSDKN